MVEAYKTDQLNISAALGDKKKMHQTELAQRRGVHTLM